MTTSYHWTMVAKSYDLTLRHWRQYQNVTAAVADALTPARRVLDAGCGSGLIAEHLAARGHLVDGVDQNREMIDLAKARVHRFPRHLRFFQQDASALTCGSAIFDGAISTNVLFAVANPGKYLAELHRVLRVGGRVAITGPTPQASLHVEDLVGDFRDDLNDAGVASALAREIDIVIEINRKMASTGFGHTFTAREMASLLAGIGFEIDDCHERFYRQALFFVAARKILPPSRT
jgi:SAM-dependent methyltransferase